MTEETRKPAYVLELYSDGEKEAYENLLKMAMERGDVGWAGKEAALVFCKRVRPVGKKRQKK